MGIKMKFKVGDEVKIIKDIPDEILGDNIAKGSWGFVRHHNYDENMVEICFCQIEYVDISPYDQAPVSYWVDINFVEIKNNLRRLTLSD
jgi:hypothetical protein